MTQQQGLTYASSGVSLEAGDEVVAQIGSAVNATKRPEVLDSIGGFGGLYALDLAKWKQPVMVSATDGVGTKLDLARQLNRHDTIGQDLVAMVVDDIVVSGAEPQFFLDYIAIGKVEPAVVTQIVQGIADGCVMANCALIGGETAEHPGTMQPHDYDIAGFAVGLVERDRILSKSSVKAGDKLVALAASGAHSNGYSLIRACIAGQNLDADYGLGASLGETLLTPTAIYTKPCLDLHANGLVKVFSHITGGGIVGNVPRVLPDGLGVTIKQNSWDIPPIFRLLQRFGNVAEEEMRRVFNLGVGMVAIVDPAHEQAAIDLLSNHGVASWSLGEVTDSSTVEFI